MASDFRSSKYNKLVLVTYQSLFFRKSFKTTFNIKLLRIYSSLRQCIQSNAMSHTSDISEPRAARQLLYGYLLIYLLTPWCRVLLEKLTGLQLVKKFPAFHGTRKFITALASVRHLSLSRASPIQSIYPHPTSWRSILILSTHLRLGLRSCLFPSGFPTKTLYTPLS